ncbi:MAG: mechanosensitive ion channel [Solobacterium sp.]|nr:mechanosensitive ion channel [Solobacterium sp.]
MSENKTENKTEEKRSYTITLASLGLGSLIIGMGARELITDIIAGLFIIFEGDFRVGDVIDVGGYVGMVQEIGLRTTKIAGWNKNVKILNNRNLTNVVNMTRQSSYALISFMVPASVDIGFLKEIFVEEFKTYPEKYPELLDVPKFMGIKSFQANSFECRVIAEVDEINRGKLEYELSGAIKQILKKNGIPNF